MIGAMSLLNVTVAASAAVAENRARPKSDFRIRVFISISWTAENIRSLRETARKLFAPQEPLRWHPGDPVFQERRAICRDRRCGRRFGRGTTFLRQRKRLRRSASRSRHIEKQKPAP